ncbi:MAG: TAXI family TRAP transporter solute-binding subunit [Chloroflexota bacterium]|nr:TAXI family TRAP transporter solute-binding subunit [Chloroflexota bacterium]
MRKHSLVTLVFLLLVVSLVLAACGAPTATPPPAQPAAATPTTAPAPAALKRISLASGPTSGVYYPLGGGIAKVISQYVPNTECTAEATAASVDNCKLLKSGKADISLIMADAAYEALNGTVRFVEDGKIPLRTIAVVYSNYMHIVASEASGVKTVADLKGKRVSTGAAGSGTEGKCLRVLEAYGITPATLGSQERLDPGKSAEAMKDRKLDAFCWDGGLPTSSVMDLAATPGMKIVLLDHEEAIKKMNDKYGPLYFKLVMPKGTYTGMDKDVAVAGVANLLLVTDKMDEQLAYNITKALFEHQADLVAVHAEAKNLTLPTAVVGSSVPYHPGAIKYYTEKGVWKP